MSEIKSKKSGGSAASFPTAIVASSGRSVESPDLPMLEFDAEVIGKAVWMGKRL